MLWRRHLRPDEPGDMDWQEANIPLGAVLGQDILLILRTLPGPANDSTADRRLGDALADGSHVGHALGRLGQLNAAKGLVSRGKHER